MEGRQPCGLEFWEPTYCTDEARPAEASWSQTRARQQVISVMESPRGTVGEGVSWVKKVGGVSRGVVRLSEGWSEREERLEGIVWSGLGWRWEGTGCWRGS